MQNTERVKLPSLDVKASQMRGSRNNSVNKASTAEQMEKNALPALRKQSYSVHMDKMKIKQKRNTTVVRASDFMLKEDQQRPETV